MTAPALPATADRRRSREFASWVPASAARYVSLALGKAANVLRGHSFDLDDLRPRRLAGDYSNVPSPHCEEVGQEFHERLVRGAVDGRCGDANFQRVAVHAGDLTPRRARLKVHREPNAAVRLGDAHRASHGQERITFSASTSSSHTTSGVMSNTPTRGITRDRGTTIQLVRTYDQRIHRE